MSSTDHRTYAVAGMTCDHCAHAVRDEVGAVPAVATVDVDLAAGRLTVSPASVDPATIREAVAEAGYEVVA
jgi:copper chaperone